VTSVVSGNTQADRLPLPDGFVQTTVTSPPYWGQRDYGHDAQSGIEPSHLDYLDWWKRVCVEIHRVTADSGTWWLNVGDTYNTRATIRPSAHQGGVGHDNESIRMTWAEHRDRGLVRYSSGQAGYKDKDLLGLPWRMAGIAQDAGWWLRCDVIWRKPYGMSEHAPDRPARSHEYLFLLSKSRQGVKSRRTD
jgi:DNA modification methylase